MSHFKHLLLLPLLLVSAHAQAGIPADIRFVDYCDGMHVTKLSGGLLVGNIRTQGVSHAMIDLTYSMDLIVRLDGTWIEYDGSGAVLNLGTWVPGVPLAVTGESGVRPH